MKPIDDEREGSTEFSDLYLRLPTAALDEANSSPSPHAREYFLAAHIACAISMAGILSESFSNQGLRHGETTVL